jgi:NAD(P)-dependent dehydrogenase (short-subunit alcohol dehydrogenase family)
VDGAANVRGGTTNPADGHNPEPKVALVTGAAHRIGRAIALSLAAQDWRLILHYHRSQTEAETLVREIATSGGEAVAVGGDLGNIDDVRQLVSRGAERLGTPPSCLVNNASVFVADSMGNLDAALWQSHMDVNLRAPAFLGESLARHLPAGVQGNVINIIDQRVLRPTPEFFSYSASKAGLWWVTQTMAQALAPRVRVNAIGPGPVLQNQYQREEDFEAERRATLLGVEITPEDIARAVHFVLASPSMTGELICLDGGQHLT